MPLVFMQHFRDGLDHWDSAITDGLGRDRPVVLFDNAGVAGSSGDTPDISKAWASAPLLSSVRSTCTDRPPGILDRRLCGAGVYYSTAELLRRLMLLGTGPRGGVPMHVTTASTQELGSVNRRAEKDRWPASWP